MGRFGAAIVVLSKERNGRHIAESSKADVGYRPLTQAPGEAVDFDEALVVIAGVEQKAHYLAMDMPHSDDCFVAAFPAGTRETFWKVIRLLHRRAHADSL